MAPLDEIFIFPLRVFNLTSLHLRCSSYIHVKELLVYIFFFFHILIEQTVDTMSYKTAHIATSVFGLHYLTIFHKKDAWLIWIKLRPIQFELWRQARRRSRIIYHSNYSVLGLTYSPFAEVS